MQAFGVGKNGGFFAVNNDLNVEVEYGHFCYNEPETGKFVYLIPEKRPRGYREGAFEYDQNDHDFDGTDYYAKFKLSITADLKRNSRIDIKKVIIDAMEGAAKQYKGNKIYDGADYKVVRDDTSIKAGYFYLNFSPGMGFWMRPYVMYIFTKSLYSVEINFTSNDFKKNEKIIEKFAKSLRVIEDEIRERNKDKQLKNKKTEVDSTIDRSLIKSTYGSQSEILDRINSIKKDVDEINANWKYEVSSSNRDIWGDKPITRANDARIKKLESNTKKIINDKAKTIELYMEMLDSIAASLNNDDNQIVEVIKLIALCFESLHMQYELFIKEGKTILVKYEIEQKYKSISVKWKKKYNKLPQVKIEEIYEKIKDTKKELSSVKRRITNNKKKKEDCNNKNAVDIEFSENTINDNVSRIDEKNNQISVLERKILEIKEKHNKDEILIKELKQKITVEKKTYDNIDKQFKTEIGEYDTKTNKIKEEKKAKETALHRLIEVERNKRSKASKSLLFKKKKLEDANSLFSQIQVIKDKVSRLDNDIDINNQIIIERQRKYSIYKDKRTILINSIESELQKLSTRIQNDKVKLQELENEKKNLYEEVIEIQKSSAELNDFVEGAKKKMESLSLEIDNDIRRRDELESLLKQYTEELNNLENR